MHVNSASAAGGTMTLEQQQGIKPNKSLKVLCPRRHIWKTKWRIPRIDLETGVVYFGL